MFGCFSMKTNLMLALLHLVQTPAATEGVVSLVCGQHNFALVSVALVALEFSHLILLNFTDFFFFKVFLNLITLHVPLLVSFPVIVHIFYSKSFDLLK